MNYTLVHCADVHLETSFSELRGGAARRAALADAFVRIVDHALAIGADALTIGGDLYESQRAGPQTRRFLFEQFARFGGPVFVVPGNHDPHGPASLLSRDDLPANVTFFDDASWRAIPLAENVTLYGFGHTPAEPGRPFARAHFDRSGVRIALVHGSDEDRMPPDKRVTAPFRGSEITAAGATFALVGHFHGGYIASDGGAPRFAYPGSPEPVKFNERGEHGAIELHIRDGVLDVRHVPIALTRLLDLECRLDGATSESDVLERCEQTLATCGTNDFVRLRLSGAAMSGTRVDSNLIVDRFRDALGTLAVIDQSANADYDVIAREPNVRGRVIADLLAIARGEDAERAADAERALRYCTAAFELAEIVP